jgi:LacI family transcriptional regulator
MVSQSICRTASKQDMATIRDVAALAGVSASTVSLALSDPARVSPSTLARVRNAVDAVGFSVNPLAQSLARGRSRLIGFVSGNVGNPFFGDIRREIETYAIEHEHFVVIGDTAWRPAATTRPLLRWCVA